MHVQRALDLAARFDYEYWLREEVKKIPLCFPMRKSVKNYRSICAKVLKKVASRTQRVQRQKL